MDEARQGALRQGYKFSRLGITEEKFLHLLEDQGYACAMCFGNFTEGERICVDHDHACCPFDRTSKRSRSCGKCVRGLLCFRCNTTLGYIELYGSLANSYLSRVTDARAAEWEALVALAKIGM